MTWYCSWEDNHRSGIALLQTSVVYLSMALRKIVPCATVWVWHSSVLEEGEGNCRRKTWERSSASSQLPSSLPPQCLLEAPGALHSAAHLTNRRRHSQPRSGRFPERQKYLRPGCCPDQLYRKRFSAEPKDWRCLPGLVGSIRYCLAHWPSLQTEQEHSLLVHTSGWLAAPKSAFQGSHR